jgi:hypothetical protein
MPITPTTTHQRCCRDTRAAVRRRYFVLFSDDAHRQVRQTVDVDLDHVAAHHRPDVFRRAGIDDVAGDQLVGFDSLAICSATDQIIWFRLALCLVWPFTLSQIAPW